MRILVTGLLEHDSGKTWTVLGLYKYLVSKGVKVSLYKPVAGHNLWYSVRSLEYTKRFKILIGEDVSLYIDVAGVNRLDLVNPIDLALAIPRLKGVDSHSLSEYRSGLELQHRVLALARFSNPLRGLREHFIAEDVVEELAPGIRGVVEELAVLLKARKVSVKDILMRLIDSSTSSILEEVASRLEDESNILLMESFNNALEPYAGALDNTDVVIVVAPGYALVIKDIDDLRREAKLLAKTLGVEGLRVGLVVERIDPEKVKLIALRHLMHPGEELSELGREVLRLVKG